MTASRSAKAPKPAYVTVNDLSGRCTAEVCFPMVPYQHLRCLGQPGHDLPHTASTSAPTSHADFAAVATVDLIWWGSS